MDRKIDQKMTEFPCATHCLLFRILWTVVL